MRIVESDNKHTKSDLLKDYLSSSFCFLLQAFNDYLEEVLMLTLDLFRDFHVRVRAAAIRVIKALSFDLEEKTVHEKYHDKILPALAVLAGDALCPSLQVHLRFALFLTISPFSSCSCFGLSDITINLS